jgi:hypothetical protein
MPELLTVAVAAAVEDVEVNVQLAVIRDMGFHDKVVLALMLTQRAFYEQDGGGDGAFDPASWAEDEWLNDLYDYALAADGDIEEAYRIISEKAMESEVFITPKLRPLNDIQGIGPYLQEVLTTLPDHMG